MIPNKKRSTSRANELNNQQQQQQQRHRGKSSKTKPKFAAQRGFDYYDNPSFEPYNDSDNGSRSLTPAHAATVAGVPAALDNNPIQKHRKCRDVLCLTIFAGAVVVMLLSIGYCHLHGDLARITHFYTTNGCDTCGKPNRAIDSVPGSGKDLTDFPYGLVTFSKSTTGVLVDVIDTVSGGGGTAPVGTIADLVLSGSSGRFTTSDCVKTCPAETKVVLSRCIPYDAVNGTTVNYVVSGIGAGGGAVFSALQIAPKSDAAGASDNIFDRAKLFFNRIAQDLENSWADIIWICVLGLGISLAMTVFLRLFAGVIIWIVVLAISLVAIAGSVALWILWSRAKTKDAGPDSSSSSSSAAPLVWEEAQVNGLLAGAIGATICTILLLLVFLILRKRISLVISLFGEAGKALHSMPTLLLQPLFTFVALTLALGSWFIIALLIESAGIPELKTVESNGSDVREHCYLEKNWIIIFSRWWNLFMIFWLTQFIVGCQHLTIAGAVSTWFFTRDKRHLHFPILISTRRLIRYHLGSIAFGSLIVAIVKIIRYAFTFVQNRLQQGPLSKLSVILKPLLCCCRCCLWCLEKFLIFLNRNAYIEIAIHGSSFCKAARQAFTLIVTNALRLATINSLGDFVLFLSKLGIVAITLVVGHELIIKGKEGLNYTWAPLVVAGICCYFIAHCFISVYEMAIDTIFICFCEDCNLNNGTDKPYFMNKSLMELVRKHGAPPPDQA